MVHTNYSYEQCNLNVGKNSNGNTKLSHTLIWENMW